MVKINKILILLLSMIILGLYLGGCEVNNSKKSISKEVEKDKIINNTKSLTREEAKVILQDIKKLCEISFEKESYTLENFEIKFTNEKIKNNNTVIDVNIGYDVTLIRHPLNSPLIKGMMQVLSELEDEKEKEIAQNTIDGYLKEMLPEYNLTERLNNEFKLELKKKNKNNLEYDLFYPEMIGGEVTMYPAEEYYIKNFKEDKSKREEMGIKIIKEELSRSEYKK